MNRTLLLGMSALMAAAPALPATPREVAAGFLYSYQVDSSASFEQAYREHLDWHREKQDHLTWYGWYVVAGARTGTFVDGTFGRDLEAIDRRPDPAGDARHFAEGAARHSRPLVNDVWRLWPEVSTDFSLEDGAPSPMLQVLHVRVEPGRAAEFEARLSALARALDGAPGFHWTWYRAATGNRHAAYLVLIPRASWAELERNSQTLDGFAALAFRRPAAAEPSLDALVADIASEIWRYRADLSYFPE